VNHPAIRTAAVFFCAALAVSAAPDRIHQPIDPSRTVAIPGQVHPKARAQYDRGALDPSFEIRYATMLLAPAAGLESFLAEQQNPASANYRRWITPEQFADRFGLSSGDIAQVTAWLQSQGLTVEQVARGRHWIAFSGTAARMSAALRTGFHRYVVNGETHFANTGDPSVPAAFSGVVAGFTGLNDFRLRPAVLSARYNSGSSHLLAPEDIAVIYDISPLYQAGIDGSGQKIAVLGQTAVALADIRAFRKRFNLPANDPQLMLAGPNPGVSPPDLVEADLDLEWSGAIAPAATLVYVYSFDIGYSAQFAVDQNVAPVITMSYGGCELANTPALRTIAQQANAQGITWVASSGDQGATACDIDAPSPQASKGLTATFPASIPEITGVGATQLTEGVGTYWSAVNDANGGSALGYIPEVAWNGSQLRHEIAATGGAASAFFAKPVWQNGAGVPNDGARDVPDVVFAGSPDHDPYLITTGGANLAVGGTSAPTPVFAGVVALLNHSLVAKGNLPQPGLGNINPLLYRLAQATTDVFHDVTAGNNQIPCEQGSPACVDGQAGYVAAPGYDLASGLGSIDVARLAAEWSTGTGSSTTLKVSPSNFDLSDTLQLTATVTGGAIPPSGSVTFIAGDISLGSAPLASGTASISAAGMLVAASTGTITALYSGDAIYNASSGTASAVLNLPASGSLVVPSVSPNPVSQSVNEWAYTVALTEKAGVATRLTGFTINGVPQNLGYWSSTNIPANGKVSASLVASGITPPLNRVYHFTGVDADGSTWTRDLTVPFLGPAGPPFVPSLTLTTTSAVTRNPQGGPLCAWSQDLTLQETSGFLFLLTGLSAGGVNMSNSIQAVFGTTRIAPYSTLRGNICWSETTPAGGVNYQVTAESEIGTTVTVKAVSSLAAPALNPPAMTVSPGVVEMLAANSSEAGTATANIDFGGAPANWTAAIVPSRAASWLKISALSGAGPAQLNLTASASGLSNGVYDATVLIHSPGALPEVAALRVAFVVGSSGAITIDSVSNAASGGPALAPGAMAIVRGSNLAASRQQTGKLPLALSLGGVSATVNGITAPLYSIAPDTLAIQIPYETGLGAAVLGINNNGLIASYLFSVQAAAPAFFTTSGGSLIPNASARQGQTITAFVTGEGDVTPFLATGASPAAGSPAKFLPQPILKYVVSVGGVLAPITFIGVVPGLVGVTQINFVVPLTAPEGAQPLSIGTTAMAVWVGGSGPPVPAGPSAVLSWTPQAEPATLNVLPAGSQ
jgi:uncharacterized protein (TIGR03437 family)